MHGFSLMGSNFATQLVDNVEKMLDCGECLNVKHTEMMKWCTKYGEMVQIIHTSSHGEMVPRESHISCHYLLNIVSIIVKLAIY